MTTNWVVLKFGGTSVSGRAQWEVIARLAQERRAQGQRVLLVCSAVAGVTNDLAALADEPGSEEKLVLIMNRHRRLAADLEVSGSDFLEMAESTLRRCAQVLSRGEDFAARAELLSVGEWLSTRIGSLFLQRFTPVSWVDVREHLGIQDEPELSPARQRLSASCAPGADAALRQRWEELQPVVITQGFIARASDGRTALLGRGGSDTSAALLAGRLGAREIEIWTDVPGLFSADPRLVSQARLLTELDYDEALEMAASGAKVVHPRSIRAAAATGTPMVIRDTTRPRLAGTRILRESAHPDGVVAAAQGVKAITCQTDMMVLLLQKIDIRREVGFLARVFDIFRRHGVSIDLVATSETTTSVAINRPANHLDDSSLQDLLSELETQCTVQVFGHCACVNLVGRAVRTALADLHKTLRFFDEHPLLMLSLSANDRCLSLLINEQDHEQLLKQAHEVLIPSGAAASADPFGERWLDISGQA